MNPFSFAKPTAPSTPPGRGWICQKSSPLSSLPPIPQSAVAFPPILLFIPKTRRRNFRASHVFLYKLIYILLSSGLSMETLVRR